MFKRMLLGVSMLAAMGVGTLGLSGSAAAHGCDYSYGPTYRAAYYPTVVSYAPQVVYYPAPYAAVRPVIVDTHHHHHHHRSGVTFTVGF